MAREPIINLANTDMNRKPTVQEVEHARQNSFLEFTLCPGDVLYIPRGYMHHATTVEYSHLKRKWRDWDECPSYPDSQSVLKLPSLHMTFALAGGNTVESLLHISLWAWFQDEDLGKKDSVVISAGTCSNIAKKRVHYDVRIRTVLHHAVAEVARRDGNSAILRQMVPLLLLSNNDIRDAKSLSDAKQADMRAVKQAYLEALTVSCF